MTTRPQLHHSSGGGHHEDEVAPYVKQLHRGLNVCFMVTSHCLIHTSCTGCNSIPLLEFKLMATV